jgi:hypothetical protein
MNSKIKCALASAFSLFILATTSQAQSHPPAWNATASYQIGDLVTYEAVEFKCLINETTVHPTPHTTYWRVSFVYSGPLTIPVGPGEVMTTLTAAWDYIAFARIADNSSVTLSLESTYHASLATSFSLDHPFGSKISIVGADAGASVNFTTSGTGFTLDSADSFGELAELTISTLVGGGYGVPCIGVTENATLSKLQNVSIENFDLGIMADSGGTIESVRTTVITGFKIGGVCAGHNATVNITSPISVIAATTSGLPPTYAFNSQGGTLLCNGCTGSNCQYNFYASDGGKMQATGAASASPNGKGVGFYAQDRSSINATSSTNIGNLTGYSAFDGSYINAESSTSNGTDSSGWDYQALQGATIDAASYGGSSRNSTGTNDGSHIFGL